MMYVCVCVNSVCVCVCVCDRESARAFSSFFSLSLPNTPHFHFESLKHPKGPDVFVCSVEEKVEGSRRGEFIYNKQVTKGRSAQRPVGFRAGFVLSLAKSLGQNVTGQKCHGPKKRQGPKQCISSVMSSMMGCGFQTGKERGGGAGRGTVRGGQSRGQSMCVCV